MPRFVNTRDVVALLLLAPACATPGGDGGAGGTTGSDVAGDSSASSNAEPDPRPEGSTGSSGGTETTVGSDGTTGASETGSSSATTGLDSSESGDVEDPPTLPAVELCDPTQDPVWQVERGGSGVSSFTAYSCTASCDDVRACSVLSEGFSEVQFVVDAMAGSFRWQLGDDLVFMHNGGTGTSYPGGGLVERVLSEGHGVAMVRWAPGSSINGAEMGWVTRPDARPTTFVRLTARIASLIAWTKETFSEGRFGTAACSAGSYVTFAAQLWHGVDEDLDYQLFVGGPPFADLGLACGTTRGPTGRCSNDPSSTCDADGECNGGICSDYINNPQAPLAEMVDSAHLTGTDCEMAVGNRAWDASDVFATEGDWNLSHPVDFVMNVGPGLGDPLIGAFAHAWDVAQGLEGAEVGWHEQPGSHCQAFSGGGAWPMLAAGMGW